MKTKLKIHILSISAFIAIMLMAVTGCGDDPTDPNTTYIDNPNVRSYDSIGVDEDEIAFQSYTGMNLLDGFTTLDTAYSRDCSLNDFQNSGRDFSLENGELFSDRMPPGFEIRFFLVSSDMTEFTFDTLSAVPGYTSFSPNDFTQNGTETWGYFNAPLSATPVYCFWLKGKAPNVYGILQPREATDNTPLTVYGYRMSFRVRINTNGDNDFREKIPQSE
jgi:hypothetical protein